MSPTLKYVVLVLVVIRTSIVSPALPPWFATCSAISLRPRLSLLSLFSLSLSSFQTLVDDLDVKLLGTDFLSQQKEFQREAKEVKKRKKKKRIFAFSSTDATQSFPPLSRRRRRRRRRLLLSTLSPPSTLEFFSLFSFFLFFSFFSFSV